MASLSIATMIAFVAAGCGSDTTAPTGKTYVANLLPSLEQPPKTTTGTGVVTFVDLGTEIDWSMNLTGMTNVVASHIHLGSTAVANGPVIYFLFTPTTPPATGTLTGFVQGGRLTNSNNSTITLDSLRVLFNNGNAYVNVHTAVNPGGEIRDQVHPM